MRITSSLNAMLGVGFLILGHVSVARATIPLSFEALEDPVSPRRHVWSCPIQPLISESKNVDQFCDAAHACVSGATAPANDALPTTAERLDYIQARYKDLITQMVSSCCGATASCIQSFTQVKFGYYTDGPLGQSPVPSYETSTNEIRTSPVVLQKCPTKGCFDAYLAHELGHACQWAWKVWRQDGLGDCDTEKFSALYPKLIGAEAYACIHDALESHAPIAQQHVGARKFCLSAAYQEAFADTFASHYWKMIEAPLFACRAGEDEEHAKMRSYMHCFQMPLAGHLGASLDPYQN